MHTYLKAKWKFENQDAYALAGFQKVELIIDWKYMYVYMPVYYNPKPVLFSSNSFPCH